MFSEQGLLSLRCEDAGCLEEFMCCAAGHLDAFSQVSPDFSRQLSVMVNSGLIRRRVVSIRTRFVV